MIGLVKLKKEYIEILDLFHKHVKLVIYEAKKIAKEYVHLFDKVN